MSRMGIMALGLVVLTLSLALVYVPAIDRLDSASAMFVQGRTQDAFLQIVPPAMAASPSPVDLGTPMKVMPGKVNIVLGASAFREGERIRATIVNGLGRAIYTDDSKTDCSIVFLERRVGNGWQQIPACPLGRAPRVVAIGSARGRVVTIDPFSVFLRLGTTPDASKPALRAGTYRIKFTYRLSPTPDAEEPFAVLSPAFRIQP